MRNTYYLNSFGIHNASKLLEAHVFIGDISNTTAIPEDWTKYIRSLIGFVLQMPLSKEIFFFENRKYRYFFSFTELGSIRFVRDPTSSITLIK